MPIIIRACNDDEANGWNEAMRHVQNLARSQAHRLAPTRAQPLFELALELDRLQFDDAVNSLEIKL